jgi:hypothetical protein
VTPVDEGTSLHELAVRVLKAPDWAWITGMYTSEGELVWAEGDNPFIHTVITSRGHKTSMRDARELVPDLSHPGTCGLLLHLVRKAWHGRYTVCGEDQLSPKTLVEALELAREAFED